MRFKNWLLVENGFDGPSGNSWDILYPRERAHTIQEYGGGGGAATSIMHGGIGEPGTNDTLPVRSKHVATDGYKKNRSGCKFDSPKKCRKDKEDRDPDSPEEGAADKFGFRTPEDKEEPKERWASFIDKEKRSAPMRVTRLHT